MRGQMWASLPARLCVEQTPVRAPPRRLAVVEPLRGALPLGWDVALQRGMLPIPVELTAPRKPDHTHVAHITLH